RRAGGASARGHSVSAASIPRSGGAVRAAGNELRDRRGDHAVSDRHGTVASAQSEGDADGEAGRLSQRRRLRHEADTMKDSEATDRTLSGALRAIAEDDAQLSASPAVESRVMAAFDNVVRARHRRRRRIVGALAATAVVVAIVAGAFTARLLNFGEPR